MLLLSVPARGDYILAHTEEGETAASMIDGLPLSIREHLVAILEDSANAFIERGFSPQEDNAKVIRLHPARSRELDPEPS